MGAKRSPYRAVLLDLEGTVYQDGVPLPGAVEAVAALRQAGLRVRYVTNTTRVSSAGLLEKLAAMGIEAGPGDLFTAVSAAAAWCRRHDRRNVLPLIREAAYGDLEGLRLLSPLEADQVARAAGEDAERPPDGVSDAAPHAVLVGDLGDDWTYDKLNVAFRCLRAGAALVACQKNRAWSESGRLSLDAGPFVAALEYAAATEAVVVGKPSPLFFQSALEELDVPAREAVMVGDDAEVDAGGAIGAGLSGWLVKTGKYRAGDESRWAPWPECVLSSLAELPAALGL